MITATRETKSHQNLFTNTKEFSLEVENSTSRSLNLDCDENLCKNLLLISKLPHWETFRSEHDEMFWSLTEDVFSSMKRFMMPCKTFSVLFLLIQCLWKTALTKSCFWMPLKHFHEFKVSERFNVDERPRSINSISFTKTIHTHFPTN